MPYVFFIQSPTIYQFIVWNLDTGYTKGASRHTKVVYLKAIFNMINGNHYQALELVRQQKAM